MIFILVFQFITMLFSKTFCVSMGGVLTLMLTQLQANAQGVGIGTSTPHASAILDISSNNKGVLLPRVYLPSDTSTTPLVYSEYPYIPTGTLVFNTNYNWGTGLQGQGFYWWDGTYVNYYTPPRWRKLAEASKNNWNIAGNVTTGNDFIGTIGNSTFPFRRNGKLAGQFARYGVKFGASATNIPQKVFSSTSVSFGSESVYNAKGSSHSTVAFGAFSKQYDSATQYGTALGAQALMNNIDGDHNIAIGFNALALTSLGHHNTAIGAHALYTNINGSYNTGIGYATSALSNLFFATAVGAEAGVTLSNSVALGGTGAAAVKVGIGTSAPAVDLDILQKDDSMGLKFKADAATFGWRLYTDVGGNFYFYRSNLTSSYINGTTGQLILTSDSAAKKDIADMPAALAAVSSLQPQTYYYLSDDTHTHTMGFVAQDVERHFPGFVHTNSMGYKGLAYNNFNVLAIKTIQEQQTILQQQEATITALRQRIEKLEKQESPGKVNTFIQQ
jgi:hypothetical protein